MSDQRLPETVKVGWEIARLRHAGVDARPWIVWKDEGQNRTYHITVWTPPAAERDRKP